jgi:hypothetical protein
VADALLSPGRIAIGGANNLLRAFGMTGTMTEQGMDEAASLSNVFGFRARERDKRAAQAIAKAGAEVRKQYSEAYEFLDAWTPDDFDVANDLDRRDLRKEMRRVNEGRLEAWMDDKGNTEMGKAARDSKDN